MDDIIEIEETNTRSIINFDKQITSPIVNYNNIEDNIEHTLLIGNSLYNDYIPFISGFVNTQKNKIDNTTYILYDLFYNKNDYKSVYIDINRRTHIRTRRMRDPLTGRLVERPNQSVAVAPIDPTDRMFEIRKLNYADIQYALSKYIIPRVFENEIFMFQCAKGIMFEYDSETKQCNLLMVLGIKVEYLAQSKPDYENNKLDVSKFALFVSNKFVTEEKYKLVYKKLNKSYIELASDSGIDIVYTNSIEKKLYNNGSEKPKFKTIDEMNVFLNSINTDLHNNLKIVE